MRYELSDEDWTAIKPMLPDAGSVVAAEDSPDKF